MIYEGVFFSFDLVLSLVAVLIVSGGFERDCLFIAARFLPPWVEIVDPSPVFEKRGGRVGDLSPWLDSRPPDLGVLAGKAEILGRSPPPLPFGTRVPDCSLAGELVAAFFAGRGLLGVLYRTIFIESSFIAHCKHFYFILIVVDIIWSCRLHSRLSIRDCGFICLFWSSLWWRGCFIWRNWIFWSDFSRNWIFWSDFI